LAGHPIDPSIDTVLAGFELPRPLQYVWGSGKTCIHGVGFDLHSMLPKVFVRVGRVARQTVAFARARRVLDALAHYRMGVSTPEPLFAGDLPGYGPMLVVRYVDGKAWQPVSNSENRSRLGKVSVWIDHLGTVGLDGLDLAPRDEEGAARKTILERPPAVAERLEEALAMLRPHIAALPAVISHGDLTVNNILWRGSTFWVVDWDDVAISYPGRDVLSLRMSWLMRLRGALFRREEDLLDRLCEPSDDIAADGLGPVVKRLPDWKKLCLYFVLTYGVTWLHYVQDSRRCWAEILLDRLAPQLAALRR
jgi:hypothetical protein